MLPELLHVLAACILHALIRVMHDSRRWPSISNRVLQSTNRQLGFEAPAERPANNLAREHIQNDGQVHKFARKADVRYVGESFLRRF